MLRKALHGAELNDSERGSAMGAIEIRRVVGPALPPAWRGYRDGYVVLQYLYALGGGAVAEPVVWPRVLADLGLGEREGERVLDHLLATRCVDYRAGERSVALTAAAVEYLERGHGRRRSVRRLAPLPAA